MNWHNDFRKQFGMISSFEHLYTGNPIVQLPSRLIPVEILAHVQQETSYIHIHNSLVPNNENLERTSVPITGE